jgi:hypothetical protein
MIGSQVKNWIAVMIMIAICRLIGFVTNRVFDLNGNLVTVIAALMAYGAVSVVVAVRRRRLRRDLASLPRRRQEALAALYGPKVRYAMLPARTWAVAFNVLVGQVGVSGIAFILMMMPLTMLWFAAGKYEPIPFYLCLLLGLCSRLDLVVSGSVGVAVVGGA